MIELGQWERHKCKRCGIEVSYFAVMRDGVVIDSKGGVLFDDGFSCDRCLWSVDHMDLEEERRAQCQRQ